MSTRFTFLAFRVFRLPFLTLLAGILFFMACGGGGSEPGSEFVGEWTADIKSNDPKRAIFKVVLEIVHNNDKQYNITAYFNDIPKEDISTKAMAFYKDGIMELDEGMELAIYWDNPPKPDRDPRRRPDYSASLSLEKRDKIIINKTSGTLSSGNLEFTKTTPKMLKQWARGTTAASQRKRKRNRRGKKKSSPKHLTATRLGRSCPGHSPGDVNELCSDHWRAHFSRPDDFKRQRGRFTSGRIRLPA